MLFNIINDHCKSWTHVSDIAWLFIIDIFLFWKWLRCTESLCVSNFRWLLHSLHTWVLFLVFFIWILLHHQLLCCCFLALYTTSLSNVVISFVMKSVRFQIALRQSSASALFSQELMPWLLIVSLIQKDFANCLLKNWLVILCAFKKAWMNATHLSATLRWISTLTWLCILFE